jgi:formylglycine-generating enzyme required for sulfatase activity
MAYLWRPTLITLLFSLVSVLPAQTLNAQGLPKRFKNSIGMTFVLIPAGQFTMGSPNNEADRHVDEQRHNVTLTQSFYAAVTEVTQEQWQAVMGSNPAHFVKCGSQCPIERISWHEAQVFIKRLNALEKTDTYRLPTEAEWEYACRSGTRTAFNVGACLSSQQANYDGSIPMAGCTKGKYRQSPVKVAEFAPNAWGLYDMHGNVWEWCSDWYARGDAGQATDPQGPPKGRYRVIRGGAWY